MALKLKKKRGKKRSSLGGFRQQLISEARVGAPTLTDLAHINAKVDSIGHALDAFLVKWNAVNAGAAVAAGDTVAEQNADKDLVKTYGTFQSTPG